MIALDIMLPYYGDVALMKLAVRSVLNQTDDRWRLTVVDDGTADGVPEWFAGLNHPQVRYLRNEHNLGLTRNFQRCLDLAEHDNLVMMGCDDVMLPNYVATVVGLLERHPDATMVQPGVEVIDAEGAVVHGLVDWAKQRIYAPRFHGTTTMRGENLAVSLMRGDWLYFPSICWRSKDIKAIGFDSRFTVVEDLLLIIQLVEQGGELVVADEPCFQYRRHAVSASSALASTGSRFAESEAFFAETSQRMTTLGWTRAARAARWHLSSRIHALTMLPSAVAHRDTGSARRLLAHAGTPMRARAAQPTP